MFVSLSYGDNIKLRVIKRIAYNSFLFSSHLSSYSALRHPATCFDVEGCPVILQSGTKRRAEVWPRRLVNTLTTQGFLTMSVVTDICDILYLKVVLTKDKQFLEENSKVAEVLAVEVNYNLR